MGHGKIYAFMSLVRNVTGAASVSFVFFMSDERTVFYLFVQAATGAGPTDLYRTLGAAFFAARCGSVLSMLKFTVFTIAMRDCFNHIKQRLDYRSPIAVDCLGELYETLPTLLGEAFSEGLRA